MARATLSRRLLTLAAGLLVGTAGVFAGSTAAMAQEIPPIPTIPEFPVGEPDAFFLPVCDGTHVAFGGGPKDLTWTVQVGGQEFWPTGGELDEPVVPGIWHVFVPADAGEIVVTATSEAAVALARAERDALERRYTWEGTDLPCDEIPAPTFTEASCDAPATVTIPLLEDLFQPGDDEPLPTLLQQVAPEARAFAAAPELDEIFQVQYHLDGEPVELGSTHELAPGSHTVSFHLVVLLSALDLEGELEDFVLRLHSWTVEVPELDCEDGGEGGELPVTGTTTALIAGGAVLLLALGAGVYLIARRRRVTFTA